MNIIHPLPNTFIEEIELKPPPYDPPPPYESPKPVINAEIKSEFSLNVIITDKLIIRINDNQQNIEYEIIINENTKFWKQNSFIFQNNYENFLKIMKLKFHDNINLFDYSFELNNDQILFRILYQNVINGFDISFPIEKSIDKLELFDEIECLKKQLNEKNNELLVDNFILEENIF